MEILKVDNLTKIYGKDTNKVVALDHVSFSVEKGEVYGLIGKNGAGKTTLMNILAGLSSADSGTFMIGGKNRDFYKNTIRIGYLPDLPSFFEYLSIGEYLNYLLINI